MLSVYGMPNGQFKSNDIRSSIMVLPILKSVCNKRQVYYKTP